ncbi:MAG TPA: alpha/beta fold hydrolase, partial [Planctomycetota bacterium]|nr:alpha/beta fold hydrolase [Planctomycetota bacterium]
MIRFGLAWLAAACASVPAQEYVHRAGGREVGRVVLSRSAGAVRGEGRGDGGARLTAVLETAGGRVRNYERELRGPDGALVARVSAAASEEGARVRDAGPLGARTRTAYGGAFDVVADPAFPEALFPWLEEKGRASFRALIVADAEIRNVLVETRGERARYVDLPGGGMTVWLDADGRVERAALPGEESRELSRVDVASRPALAGVGAESRAVVEAPGGAKLGVSTLVPTRSVEPPALAVILADAGPLDRDGFGAGRQGGLPRRLAEELARVGIASARFDKRGAGASEGPEPGLADLASDAKAVLDHARAATGVPPSRTVVVGHGEGALVAAELAVRHPEALAGVVTLAAPGRSLADALEARLRARLAAAGEKEETIQEEILAVRAEVDALRGLPSDAPTPPGRKLLRDLAALDPALQLTRVRTPVLAVHAADDPEVPAAHVSLLR